MIYGSVAQKIVGMFIVSRNCSFSFLLVQNVIIQRLLMKIHICTHWYLALTLRISEIFKCHRRGIKHINVKVYFNLLKG